MADVRLIDANALKEKSTCLWDSALGHCPCVLIEDVDSAPTINPDCCPNCGARMNGKEQGGENT